MCLPSSELGIEVGRESLQLEKWRQSQPGQSTVSVNGAAWNKTHRKVNAQEPGIYLSTGNLNSVFPLECLPLVRGRGGWDGVGSWISDGLWGSEGSAKKLWDYCGAVGGVIVSILIWIHKGGGEMKGRLEERNILEEFLMGGCSNMMQRRREKCKWFQCDCPALQFTWPQSHFSEKWWLYKLPISEAFLSARHSAKHFTCVFFHLILPKSSFHRWRNYQAFKCSYLIQRLNVPS